MSIPKAASEEALRETLFRLAFALMMTHELDAVARLEWRVLPITSWMPDAVGFHFFIVAHVPLVVVLTRWAWGGNPVARERLRYWFCAFCVLHAGLHWAYRNHPEYRFDNPLSVGLIWSCAATGFAWLTAWWWARRPASLAS